MHLNLADLHGADTDYACDRAAGEEDADALMDLVEDLVQRRHAAGLSTADVARRMAVTVEAVGDLERPGGDPTVNLLQRYARAVGTGIDISVTLRPL